MNITATLANSPIEKVNVAGHDFLIKRDDLLNPHFSGNKARKFANYLQQDQSLIENTTHKTHLVSYGSIQANSLYSLAALAYIKGWQLHYYVSRIPSWLKGSTLGNYGQAIALGAKIIEVDDTLLANIKVDINIEVMNLDHIMRAFSTTLPHTHLFIPEGGRHHLAQLGINTLAQEIAEYCDTNQILDNHDKTQIMLPSGTGTTALFLQTWFKENNYPIEVLTCACVGDELYLQQQFNELNTNKEHWPTILPSHKKFHFGKLNQSHYLLWQQLLQESKIEFELLYDPVGWQCLLDYLAGKGNTELENINTIKPKTAMFYIHQGGLMGNQTMLPRYKRKFPELF